MSDCATPKMPCNVVCSIELKFYVVTEDAGLSPHGSMCTPRNGSFTLLHMKMAQGVVP